MRDLYFSVVIPLYNKEKSICSTINSVLNQTYKNFELLIINDGSTDRSLEMAKSIEDQRIKIIDKKNGGVSSARNTGLLTAENKYIALLDSDDLWLENHLETLVTSIENYPNQVLYYTKYIHSGKTILKVTEPSKVRLIGNYCQEVLKNTNNVWSSCVCLNKNMLQNNLFNDKLTHGEDIEFWVRLSRDNEFVYCDQVTAIYRLDAENRSILNDSVIGEHHYFFNIDFKNTVNKYELKYLKSIYFASSIGLIASFKFLLLLKYLKHYKFRYLLELFFYIFKRLFLKILKKVFCD
jgi:glycosyltransferase involved in cell wall biosynthesis